MIESDTEVFVMNETIKLEMTEDEAAQLRELLEMFVKKIKQIFEQMEKDQAEIEQYRAETRAITERLKRKAA
jgi:hypothetical protein